MALRRRPPEPTLEVGHEPSPIKSLVASAARIRKLDGLGWRTYTFGDNSWQQEVWRLYDIIGELRFAANWVGSACSRVRIYVAEVDKNGRVQKEVDGSKKARVAGLADTLFGSAAAKAEALRLMGINLTIAGECYVVGRGVEDAESDEWYVVSCSELKRWGGSAWMLYPDGSKEALDLDKDIVIRVWTPHPRRSLWADSPTRAAMAMLWEIERLTRYVFAQIDSRLVSAGLLPIPKETSFPDEDENLPGAESLTQRLLKTGSSSLKGEGTAAGVVPTIVEMPLEALGKIELVGFASELSKQALDLRAEAIRRFALAMDIAPEILTGTGDANHWSAWHVAAENVKVHIEPLMTRICDALTSAYLVPALKAINESTDKYIFWYDTAPLIVRPERLKDTLNLNEKGIVSDETVLIEGDYKLSDKPTPEEDLRKFTRTLMERDPNLFQIPAVRKIAGYTDDILPPDTVVTPQVPGQPGMPGAGPPPPPPPPTGIQPTGPSPMPQESSAANTPGGPATLNNSTRSPALTASAGYGSQALFAVANMAVLRALEVAGKRLVGNHHRVMPEIPAYDLHTRVTVGGDEHATRLLSGAWDQMSVLSEHMKMPELSDPILSGTLHRYCATLLVKQHPHEAGLLWEMLSRQGFLDGES